MPARMTGRAFFGRRLRIAREQQVPKVSRRALAERLNLSGSAIAAWESGRNMPDPQTLEKVERILSTNGLLKDIVECMVTGEKPQEYAANWVHVEANAATLPRFTYDLIPGLLQTEEYARAILRDDEQVRVRIERQKVLAKEEPPVVIALIDESVLYRNVGGPTVMREQLRHLAEMANYEYITIHVIKLRSPVSAQFTGPFSLASYNGEAEIGFVDDAISGGVVQNADEVAKLRRMFEIFRKHALGEEESIRLIKEAEGTWTD
jgi:transcriptional regulator with XRE-family HTH domain